MRNNQCSIVVGILVILALSALVQIYYSKKYDYGWFCP